MQADAIELVNRDNRCRIPSLIATEQKNYEVCKSFDFGSSLQDVYPLLRFVFEYLRYADLISAGKINDTWGKYAEEELARRKGPSWLCLTKSQTARHILERSANFMYDEVTFSLVFYKNEHMKLNKLNYYKLNNLHGTEQHKEMSFEDYLIREALPKGKEFWTVSCHHVSRINMISTNMSNSLFSILSIPSIPHVAIRRFAFSKTDVRNILDANLQSDEIIDCLLVFSMFCPGKYIETFVHEILRRQEADTIALCGGRTRTIKLFNRPNTSALFYANRDDMCCIAFTRKRDTPADFDAFSLVIKKGDDFEAKVSDFRRRMPLRKNSFMIRVCCAAKVHTETEVSLINKYFPRTPVIGFLTTVGEIGCDRLPRSEDRDAEDYTPKKKKSKVYPETWHQYSTVLALVTWGHKV